MDELKAIKTYRGWLRRERLPWSHAPRQRRGQRLCATPAIHSVKLAPPLAIEDMALVHLKNRIVSFFTPLVRERPEVLGGRRSAGKRHANGTPATGAGRVATRDRMIEVNLIGSYLTCRSVVPHMVAKGLGRIVNIASVAGKEGNPNASHYSESTAGVIGLTQSPGNGHANNQAHSGVHAARSGRRQPRSRPATLDRRSLRNADEPLPRVPQQPAELRC